jgi:uncharacterized protein YndB with AHSA1/START domain
MIEFSVEAEIARSVPEVFAYVTDPAKLPTWQEHTISLTREDDGPLGVGSRLREVHQVGDEQIESVVEVTEFEPDRAFAVTMVDGPLPLDARVTFAPSAIGTLLCFEGRGEPNGAMKLASPLLGRTLKGHFAKHSKLLKDVLEADR